MKNKSSQLISIFARTVVIALGVMAASAQVLAEPSCKYVLVDATAVRIIIAKNVDPKKPDVKVEFINAETPQIFEDMIHKINSELIDYLKLPEQVVLYVAPLASDPHSLPDQRSIFIGERFGMNGKKKGYLKDPSHSWPILAHEYGHIIFFENARIVEPILIKLDQLMVAREQLFFKMRTLAEEYKALLAQKDKNLSPEELKSVEAQIEEKIESFKSLNAEGANMASEFELFRGPVTYYLSRKTPYDEFYADVVAVLFTGKPNVVEEAINIQGDGILNVSPDKLKKADAMKKIEEEKRAFDGHLKRSDLKEYGSEHGVFSEARGFMWDQYLSRPSILENKKGEVLALLHAVIIKEINWSLQNNANVVPTDAPMLNAHLIESIKVGLASLIEPDLK